MLPTALDHPNVHTLLTLALQEDLTAGVLLPDPPSSGDVTATATIPAHQTVTANFLVKARGVVAGLPIAQEVFRRVDANVTFEIDRPDGSPVQPSDVVARVTGNARSILVAERPALNFLGRLSGIATLTAQFVAAIAGTGATMLDTRKTAPGFRLLDKYAVRMGGGKNHRLALYDMAMIKDNHVAAVGGVLPAVERIRALYGETFPIILEVTTLAQLQQALPLAVTRILLDNMDLPTLRQAVALRNQFTHSFTPLEASGGVTLQTVRQIAETGVEYISSGALTHSATVFDMSLEVL
jgi:nicotinate-nucleotide pyrophosphorylase (carboxylating)